jgi:hypothetical protein
MLIYLRELITKYQEQTPLLLEFKALCFIYHHSHLKVLTLSLEGF